MPSAAILAVTIAACSSGSSGSSGSPSAGPTPAACTDDEQCPSGQGCNRDDGSIPKGYCAALCAEDEGCPTKVDCPGSKPSTDRDCREKGKHRDGKGVCELYDGAKTPEECGGSTTGGACLDGAFCCEGAKDDFGKRYSPCDCTWTRGQSECEKRDGTWKARSTCSKVDGTPTKDYPCCLASDSRKSCDASAGGKTNELVCSKGKVPAGCERVGGSEDTDYVCCPSTPAGGPADCADIVACSDAYDITASGESCDACLRDKCQQEIADCGPGGRNCTRSSECFTQPFLEDLGNAGCHTVPDCYILRQACEDARTTEPPGLAFFQCMYASCREACALSAKCTEAAIPACSVLRK